MANIFTKIGYRTQVTDYVGDKGVDIWAHKDGFKYPIQCKARKKPISPGVARELYGTMNSFGCDKAFLVSRSGFSKGVYEFCATKSIELIDLSALINIQKKIADIEEE